MTVLEAPDASARQVLPQTKLVSAQTGGARYVAVAHSGSEAQEGSDCGRSQRLKSRRKLLVARLAE